MRLVNKLDRSLSVAEDRALQQARLILEAAFGKNMFNCTVNADNKDGEEVFGISYAFDMRAN